jgi:uncharacterized protein
MNDSLGSRLDPEALADAGRHFGGHIDAAKLDVRLARALDMDTVSGEVRYALDFQRLPNSEVGLSGAIEARLVARCQRCLEPFKLNVTARPRVQISASSGNQSPEEGFDPGAGDPAPTLAALIEDELLLALPLSPRHAERDCPAEGQPDAPGGGDMQRPFSELGKLLSGHRESDR